MLLGRFGWPSLTQLDDFIQARMTLGFAAMSGACLRAMDSVILRNANSARASAPGVSTRSWRLCCSSLQGTEHLMFVPPNTVSSSSMTIFNQ